MKGNRADWESWTGLCIPQTGKYILQGGLAPKEFAAIKNRGEYKDPNVWMI